MPVRLPFPPGVEYDYMAEPPPGTLPLTWDAGFRVEDDSLPNNTKYILQDQIAGVETVALGPEGWLGLVDKHGQVRCCSVMFVSVQLLFWIEGVRAVALGPEGWLGLVDKHGQVQCCITSCGTVLCLFMLLCMYFNLEDCMLPLRRLPWGVKAGWCWLTSVARCC